MSTNYDQIDLKSLTNSALCALVEQLKEQNKSLSNRVHELDAISSKNLTLAKHFQKVSLYITTILTDIGCFAVLRRMLNLSVNNPERKKPSKSLKKSVKL